LVNQKHLSISLKAARQRGFNLKYSLER